MKRGTPSLARILLIGLFLFCCARAGAATGGSISGTVADKSGGVVEDIDVFGIAR